MFLLKFRIVEAIFEVRVSFVCDEIRRYEKWLVDFLIQWQTFWGCICPSSIIVFVIASILFWILMIDNVLLSLNLLVFMFL